MRTCPARGWGERLYHICRLEGPLHTTADTWFHQDVSGRWHQKNNVVLLESLSMPHGFHEQMAAAWRDVTSRLHNQHFMQVAHL
ncbi:hypothetical protein DFAR_1030014 [Desulfarculales bacterium]